MRNESRRFITAAKPHPRAWGPHFPSAGPTYLPQCPPPPHLPPSQVSAQEMRSPRFAPCPSSTYIHLPRPQGAAALSSCPRLGQSLAFPPGDPLLAKLAGPPLDPDSQTGRGRQRESSRRGLPLWRMKAKVEPAGVILRR